MYDETRKTGGFAGAFFPYFFLRSGVKKFIFDFFMQIFQG